MVKVGDVSALPAAGVSHLFGDWYRVNVAPGETPEQAIQRLAALSAVEVVELEYLISVDPSAADSAPPPPGHDTAALAVPDDPLYGQQWNLPMVQAATAWDSATGEGVIVAVIDSGVSEGSDLACHLFVDEYNAILDASGSDAAADDFGHGTHIAGTIAQCTNNGLGVAGVAYQAQIMPVKVLDAQGNGSYADVARGVDWARTHGADVINLSLGGRASSTILGDAIIAAAAADIVIVAAAGNAGGTAYGANIYFPANMVETIAVAAVDFQGIHAPYSNRGIALNLERAGR